MNRARWLTLAAVLAAVGSVLAWGAESSAGARSADATADGVLDGATLFRTKGCATCHTGPDSTVNIGSSFPSLAEASLWAGDRRSDLTAAEYMSESIREPWAFLSPTFVPGSAGPTTAMPALGLSDDEVNAVVEYLLSG